MREQHTQHAARQCEQRALGHQLLDDPVASRADRRAQRDLVPAPAELRREQPGEICARNEQNESGSGQNEPGHVALLRAQHDLPERSRHNLPAASVHE